MIATAVLSWIRICQGQTQFIPPTNEMCACPNQNLTYTCTVEGPGATVWNGTAFTCPTQAIREITLRHSNFNDNTAFGECNDGTVIARGVNVRENRFYTSELIVNVRSELNGSIISCVLSSEVRTTIGSAQIIIVSGPYQQVPNVILTDANTNTLRFCWMSIDPSCPSISYMYESTTSGCGSCSITTNTTTATAMATCTGLQLGSMCMFSVRSAICGFIGMPSNRVTVRLTAPDPPQVTIIPVYSADTNSLAKLLITINRAINGVTDPLFGAVTEYTTSYSGGMQRNTSCADDQCEYEVRAPFPDCDTSSSSITTVTVSASNLFGQGEASMPQNLSCTNQFVHVTYTSSAIVCTFLNALDTSVKSCTVMYGSCDQELDERRSGNSTVDRPNYIEIQLDSSITSMNCFMYTVTASNVTYRVMVEATRNMRSGTNSQVVVIATLVPILVVLVAITVVMVLAISIVRRNQSSRPPQAQAQSQRLREEYFEPHAPNPKEAHNPNYVSELHPDYLEYEGRVEGDKEASVTQAAL